MFSFLIRKQLLFDFPIILASLWDPPAPGIVPIVISGWPNFALSPAIMISHIMANSHPPPKAQPLTEATIGFLLIFKSIKNGLNMNN